MTIKVIKSFYRTLFWTGVLVYVCASLYFDYMHVTPTPPPTCTEQTYE